MSENAEQEQALVPAQRRGIEEWVNLGYRGSVILIVVLSGIYALSPVDAVPDILPVIGQIDDIATLAAGGGSVAFLTAIRPLAVAIAKRPVLRAGCITVIAIVGLMMLAGALLVFYGIYLLIDAL
jgi:uncharacterized membrane protein YkvA (DUF1232 family)